MAKWVFHQNRVTDGLAALCSFGAFARENSKPAAFGGRNRCRLCIGKGPAGAANAVVGETPPPLDKDAWRGVAVFAEQLRGQLAPVVFELLGKARQLAGVVNQPVYALLAGHGMRRAAEDLLCYGPDEVFVYDHPALEDFNALSYAAAMEDFISRVRPAAVLVGATNLGRSLAPRVAARFGTGLTADCTRLEMRENTDLVQIRPAFGGNIMARIITPMHRPQFCTVRHKVFPTPEKAPSSGKITPMEIADSRLESPVRTLALTKRDTQVDISEAEVIVAVGRGVKRETDLALARRLAESLGAQLACTRPLVENGWFDARWQIGLSGHTVKPRVIITLGVSGALQFTAGMRDSDLILAVNTDPAAPIFDIAHHGFVGDLYAVVPTLLDEIDKARASRAHGDA